MPKYISSLNWRTNETYCVFILVFLFCFHVYLVFEYNMEFFAKIQLLSCKARVWADFSILKVGRDITLNHGLE